MTISESPSVPIDRIVDNHTYWDPEVFRLEQEKLFAKAWRFVAHESEIAKPGDYITTEIANSPIIVARDQTGRLRAFFNTCRHRASLVVTEASGHCASFRCPYHFWVYSLDGSLIGIPEETAYEGTGFRKEDNPLVSVKCESVLGLVFVNLDPDAMPLAEWLDGVVDVLKRPLANAKFEVINHQLLPAKVNWKVWAENSRDGYHVPFVHPFFRRASPPHEYHLLANGHAVQKLGMDEKGVEPELWKKIIQYPFPGLEVGEGYIVTIFPDLTLMLRSNVITIDSQEILGAQDVVLHGRQLGLVGDTPEQREIRLVGWHTWFNDPLELEDLPIFLGQQKGVQSRGVRYSVIARGEQKDSGLRGDDNRLRHFWVQWRKFMGTAANSIDPV